MIFPSHRTARRVLGTFPNFTMSGVALNAVDNCKYLGYTISSVNHIKSNQIYLQAQNTLCFKKSDAKIQITITMAHRIRINYPLSSFNYCFSGTNVANFNKIHHIVSE